MTDLVGRRLGDFEVTRELGRGGMGVVYEAVQLSLNRRVALKVLGPGIGLTPRAVDRFRREAEAAAKLHHTNVVPVYATGAENGWHFYAMELIDGRSLDRVVKDLASRPSAGTHSPPEPEPDAPRSPGHLALTAPFIAPSVPAPACSAAGSSGLGSGGEYFDAVARMVADVADALHQAHQQNVIHRDVKPSNLLLSPDGRLSLTDFGLARVLEQPGMTVTGEFVGTPAYMAPEQIAGGRVPVDRRCDIYSLGATLYELLTLRPPFAADSRDMLLAMVLQKDPVPPRSVNPQVPRDLETICLKCLEKDPDRRYRSAQELTDDLRRYVNRFAILARRTGPLGRLKKWVKRNPAVTTAGVATLLAVGAAGFFAYQSHLSEQRAEESRRRHTEELQEERRKSALASAMERAVLAAMRDDTFGVKQGLDDVKTYGASEAEFAFLEGQIALHRGESVKAIASLSRAAQLAPDWPAAQAVLLRAYRDAGQFDEFYNRLLNLKQLEPHTPEDYLYLGQLYAYAYPEKALPFLNEAIVKRPSSVLARLIRAEVRVLRAQDTGSLADADAALKAAEDARQAMPGNPIALSNSLEAQLVAAITFRREGAVQKRDDALRQAARDAEDLNPHRSVAKAVRARTWFFDQTNDLHRLRAEYLRDRESTGGASAGRVYFYRLYGRGEFTEALGVLELMPRAGNEVMYRLRRGFVLADQDNGKPTRALAEYHAALDEWKQARPYGRITYAHMILLFLGHKKEAVEIYRKLAQIESTTFIPVPERRTYQYRSGGLSADEYLASAGLSLCGQCEVHFCIGLQLLAGGDRRGAREHFEKSVATGVFNFLEYDWSRAFLVRMESDENWPTWLQKE
jgi:serine/threonine protein kinase